MGLSDMVYVSKTEEKEMREARERARVRGGEGSFLWMRIEEVGSTCLLHYPSHSPQIVIVIGRVYQIAKGDCPIPKRSIQIHWIGIEGIEWIKSSINITHIL